MIIVHSSILFGEMSLLIPYSFLNWLLCLFIWSCKKVFVSAISFALKYNPVAPSVKVSWIALITFCSKMCLFSYLPFLSLLLASHYFLLSSIYVSCTILLSDRSFAFTLLFIPESSATRPDPLLHSYYI